MMKITSKGQVTIPQNIREKHGLLPNTEVTFCERNGRVFLEKISGKPTRGRRLIEKLRGSGEVKMTTNQIMELTRGH